MTTGTMSNYGSVFGIPSGTYYPCIVVDYPEFKSPAIDITNHGSGGVDEVIYSGLVTSGEFTLSILGQHGTLSAMKGYQTNKTVNICHLANPLDSYVFSGLVTNVKEEASDAQKPDAVKIALTVKPSGTITIANTP